MRTLCCASSTRESLSRRLAEVVHHVVVSLALLTEVSDGDTTGADHLARQAILVDLAQARPLPQRLVVGHVDEGHVLLQAQALNQLLVCRLVARLREEDDLGLAGVDVLRNLMKAPDRTVDDQRILEDLLDGAHQVGHLLLSLHGRSRNLILLVTHISRWRSARVGGEVQGWANPRPTSSSLNCVA